MPHCIVVMYANAKKPEEYNTHWLDEVEAFNKVKQEAAKGHIYPAWIGWSYYFGHTPPDVEYLLNDLAKTVIKSYKDTVDQRSMFQVAIAYSRRFINPVRVFYMHGNIEQGYGFAFARCPPRGV